VDAIQQTLTEIKKFATAWSGACQRSFCKWSGKRSREKLLLSSIAWTQKWQ